MTTITIENRLEALEKEVADLKKAVFKKDVKPNWLDKMVGSFKNDPEFDEILRLGREIRRADHPDKNQQPES